VRGPALPEIEAELCAGETALLFGATEKLRGNPGHSPNAVKDRAVARVRKWAASAKQVGSSGSLGGSTD